MALPKVTDSVTNITDQPVRPVISASALQALFDEIGKDLKVYLNDSLTVALESITDGSSGADNIGATPLIGGTANTVQGVLEELNGKSPINIADDSITDQKLKQTGNNILPNFNSHVSNKIKHEANIVDFGAIGDGITDNSVSISSAISYLSSQGGGILVIPEGTFASSTPLDLTGLDYVLIKGRGSKSVIKIIANVNGVEVNNVGNYFKIKDIRIVSAYVGNIGINAVSVHNSYFENVVVTGFNDDGIKSTSCYITTYENCHVYENKGVGLNLVDDGVSFNNIVRINKCNITKNGIWNVVTDGSFAIQIESLSCEQKDTLLGVQTLGSVYIKNSKVLSIDGLYYEAYKESGVANFGTSYRAIKLGDFATSKNCVAVSIENAYVSNNSYGLIGIDFDYASDCSIKNSNIRRCTEAIKISSNSNRNFIDEGVIFDNNTVSNVTDSSSFTTYRTLLSSNEQLFSQVVDLSDPAETIMLMRGVAKYKIIDIKIYYTEATDANAGVTLNIGTTADPDYYATYVTELNKSIFFVKTMTLLANDVASGGSVVLTTSGNKVGTGKVQVYVEYKLIV